jgi:hypothetical protein
MAEKLSNNKTVQFRVNRGSGTIPRVLVATAFRLRKLACPAGFIEVSLKGSGVRGERVILDPTLLRSNLLMLKKYAASLGFDGDEDTQDEELPIGEAVTFCNIVHFSRMGGVAETNFGVFSLSDWVEATRTPGEKVVDIHSVDALRLISNTAMQQQLLNELILILTEAN